MSFILSRINNDIDENYYGKYKSIQELILSLSSVWNNILMWSHYASQHKGIVLIFMYIPSNGFYEKMMKVRYKNGIEFFELSHSNKDKKIWESFSTKHTMWEYENEYRIISPPSAPDMFDGAKIKPFPKELLFGIIFGIRTLNQHKVDINKWISRYCPQLRIFQAKAKVDDIGIEKVCLERQMG